MSGEVSLEVLNTESMLVHHMIRWDIENVSNKPIPALKFSANGAVPKPLSELNLRITDLDNKTQLAIQKDYRDKPLRKTILISSKPSQPNEKTSVLLEYDWEEVERKYLYGCWVQYRKLSLNIIVPKKLQTKCSIHKFELKTFEPVKCNLEHENPFHISDNKVMSVVEWTDSDIAPFTGYRFDW